MWQARVREKIELTVEPIWERQPGETNTQYMWFTRYKESKLNGGSFSELCKRFNRKDSYKTMLQLWSAKNRWTARVEAYRDYLEKEKEERKLASFDEMNNRHLKSSTLLQNIFASWLSTNRDKIETLKPETALRFFDVGVKLERLAVSAAQGVGGEETKLVKQAKNLVTPDGEFDMVDVQEFVESKYYMGQKDAVRPKIMEKLWELFHGEHAEDNLEVVLGGGIGWGKSFMAEMGLAYMLYKLSRYPSPQEEFGLAPGSSMYFIMQSVKQELAKKVLFGQFAQRLQRSEYFCKNFPFDKSIMSELRFPNNITILPLSSSDTSALGLNVFGGCFPAEQEYLLADGTLAKLGDCRTESVLTVSSPEKKPVCFGSSQVRSIPTGIKRLVRVHLANGGSLLCTPDQRFKSAEGDWCIS